MSYLPFGLRELLKNASEIEGAALGMGMMRWGCSGKSKTSENVEETVGFADLLFCLLSVQ